MLAGVIIQDPEESVAAAAFSLLGQIALNFVLPRELHLLLDVIQTTDSVIRAKTVPQALMLLSQLIRHSSSSQAHAVSPMLALLATIDPSMNRPEKDFVTTVRNLQADRTPQEEIAKMQTMLAVADHLVG